MAWVILCHSRQKKEAIAIINTAANERTEIEARISREGWGDSIGALLVEAAKTYGDRPAAVFFEQDSQITYAELDLLTDRFAMGLLERGIRKGAHVAVMLPNTPAFLIAWFGLAKLGAVMVPANTRYTATELDFLLNQSDSQMLIIDSSYLYAFNNMVTRPDILTEDRVIIHDQSDLSCNWHSVFSERPNFNPPVPVTGSDLANIQFTSGTTGFPKGCMQPHDYWLLASKIMSVNFVSEGLERFLIWGPFFYMDPQWMFLTSLRLGATSYIANRMQLGRVYEWLADYAINFCSLPEPALARFPQDRSGDDKIRLKFVMSYGWRSETFVKLADRFCTKARDCYGMTEIGVGTLMPRSPDVALKFGLSGPVGPMREMRIVGPDQRDVKPGDVGELWVRGKGLMLGYYKRPDANAEVFTDDWFHTGDLFVSDGDGFLKIIGRIKEMIRRSGENISAREVESVLKRHSDVADAAVIAVPDAIRKEEVKAFVQLATHVETSVLQEEIIVKHCREHLAAFKVPRYFEFVSKFPRTPTGKIKKGNLS